MKILLKLYFKGNDKKPFATIEIDNEEIYTLLMQDVNNKELEYVSFMDLTFKRENLNYIIKEYK